ncbi:MAG: hypothetical protein IJS30_07305 [Bacteroidales bacterium]|nr:hypothetical protein [Bacteroidales bacterium]
MSKLSVCSYEAPASDLIVIDCKGAMMQAAISDWQHGGEFNAPFEGPLEIFEVSAPEFVLYDDSESN